MESFLWNEGFLTEIDDVDQQHHHLVDVINRLGHLLASNDAPSPGVLNQVFHELTEYTHYHFNEEEALMQAAHLDERHQAPHIQAHRQFIIEVSQLHAAITPDNRETSEQMMKFLVSWLAYHILGTDKSMARQLTAIASGIAPAAAFDAEQHEQIATTEPLLNALHGLFQQVSARNRELSELNNTLELRVAERTQALAEANAQLRITALTDVLTGLPNRRHAIAMLSQAWQRSATPQSPLSCMMIDADGFKQVNDRYGHDAGDEVLRQLGKQLQYSVRNDDFTARLGGDEFLIICPATDLHGAQTLAEILRSTVSKLQLRVGNGLWHGSISIGVATRTPAMRDPDALIKAADTQVYRAKQAGRNCVRSALSHM